jgi:hypothetical protein
MKNKMQQANWKMSSSRNKGMINSLSTYGGQDVELNRGLSPLQLNHTKIHKRESDLARSANFSLGNDNSKVISEAKQNFVDNSAEHNAKAFVIS